MVGGASSSSSLTRSRSRSRLAEVAEPAARSWSRRKISGLVGVGLLPALDLGDHSARTAADRSQPPTSTACGRTLARRRAQDAGLGIVLGRAVEDDEPGPDRTVSDAAGGILRGQADQGRGHDAQRRLVVLADDQEVVAPPGGGTAADGRVLDRDRVAEPGLGRARRLGGQAGRRAAVAAAGSRRGRPARRPRRRSASRDRTGVRSRASSRSCFRYILAAVVGEPDDLEEVVALDQAVGVVVDRLAGAGEQLGGASCPR